VDRSARLEISPEDARARLASEPPPVVVDVREPDEVTAWPFPGSVHVPLGQVLAGRLGGVPADRALITLCHSGNRSLEAAQFLRRIGLSAQSLRGGITGWSRVYETATVPLRDGEIVQLRRLGKGCLSYVVLSEGVALVVDPSWQIDRYREVAAGRGARIRRVIDTHLHADHVSGARRLAEAAGATLHLNPVEGYVFGGFQATGDGVSLRVGAHAVTALAAPGHTAGSLAWNVADRALLTGDALFLESVGRPDLHGHVEAAARRLYHTLRRLATLPDDVLVLPGHAPDDTSLVHGRPHADRLGVIRARLRFDEEDEATFVARVSQVPEKPPNMTAILEINREGRPASDTEAGQLEEGPNRCAVKTA
jgi:glyoxylase-like metal-dependent hydrolase (beta-lactamase superfamily II)